AVRHRRPRWPVDLRRGSGRLRGIAVPAVRFPLQRTIPPVASEEESALEARLLAAAKRRGRPVATADLLRAARVGRGERRAAEERLAALEASGRLVRSRGDRWALPARLDLVAGRLQGNPAGFAFVVPDDPGADDVYVPVAAVRPAMHGDRVLVRVERLRRRGRTEG